MTWDDYHKLGPGGQKNYWAAVNLLDKAFSLHDLPADRFPSVKIDLEIEVEHLPLPLGIEKLQEVYEVDSPLNLIAMAMFYSGVTVDDLLLLEADLRGFIPKKHLHPTKKFELESAAFGMEGFDVLRVNLPIMTSYKDDDGTVKEAGPAMLDDGILCKVWNRVYQYDESPKVALYQDRYDLWKKVRFDHSYEDYTE